VEEEHRPGYYKDENGVWRKDRRMKERRNRQLEFHHNDRRVIYRRKTDREILDRETQTAIDEAITELRRKD